MSSVVIWHNPRCGKSREGLAILEENGCEIEVRKYLDATPSVDEIKEILRMLQIDARSMMRTKEAIYKELNLKEENDENKLIEAMAQNPKLIERPIVIKGGKAVIGRPPSLIADLVK